MSNQFFHLGREDFINKEFNWMSIDNEEAFQKNKDIVPYSSTDIVYKYNNYGFRCDDFTSWTEHPYRILFAGCSMTEGIGVPLEDLWAKQVCNMVSERLNTPIPYWTIASYGTGIDQLVRYFYYVKNILKPQIVISYLPNKVRRERWNGDRWSLWSEETDTQLFVEKDFVDYQTQKNIAMIDLMMRELDGYFLFSSSMKDFNIKNYSRSPRLVQRRAVPEQYDVGRDNVHAGPETNKVMAERAFEFFWPFIEQRMALT